MTKKKPIEEHKRSWRPGDFTDRHSDIFLEGLRMDMTLSEACCYAWVSMDSYYTYLKNHPNFKQDIEDAKQAFFVALKKTINNWVKQSKNHEFALKVASKRQSNLYAEKNWNDWPVVNVEIKNVLDELVS